MSAATPKGFVGVLDWELGYKEAEAYFNDPANTLVPDQEGNQYQKGVYSLILSKLREVSDYGGEGGRLRVVADEAELDAAITTLNAASPPGGAILIAGPITLTEDKVWDLSFIRILGDRVHAEMSSPQRIFLNGKTITNVGQTHYYEGITFVGNKLWADPPGDLIDAQKAFLFAEGESGVSNRVYTYLRCHFLNLVGHLTTTPVIDMTGLNGGTYNKRIRIEFDGCSVHTDGQQQFRPLGGLIVYVGTVDGVNGIHSPYMFVSNCTEGLSFGRNRWGMRVDNVGVGHSAFIWHDDTTQIVESNVRKNSMIGARPYNLVSGTYNSSRGDIGKALICDDLGGVATVNLPAATHHDAADIGAQFEVFGGLEKLNIVVPNGVSVYWRGVQYTNTTIVVTEAYAKAAFCLVGLHAWQMTDSWVGDAFVPGYNGNDAPGTGLNTLAVGKSRVWNKVDTAQSFIVTRAASGYRLVELTPHA